FSLSNEEKSTRKIDAQQKRALPVRLDTKTRPADVRILLVEDHEPTRMSLAMILTRRNYKVALAASLSEARALVENERFTILISDIGLPDGNGCELMEELRE